MLKTGAEICARLRCVPCGLSTLFCFVLTCFLCFLCFLPFSLLLWMCRALLRSLVWCTFASRCDSGLLHLSLGALVSPQLLSSALQTHFRSNDGGTCPSNRTCRLHPKNLLGIPSRGASARSRPYTQGPRCMHLCFL